MKITAIWCAGLVLATVDASAAATDFDSFVQPDPFVQANAAFAHGEVSAAESLIAPLTQGRTPRADACALLGEIRMSQKRSNEGVELFQRAAILSPKNASYQSRLGNALLQSMGEVDESRRSLLAGQALTALRHSVELDPDDCDGYLGLANFYAAAPEAAGGGYDKAIQAAGELKKRQPAGWGDYGGRDCGKPRPAGGGADLLRGGIATVLGLPGLAGLRTARLDATRAHRRGTNVL
jgi:tetratricopeptide (TPR) repeat protein